MNNVEAVFSFFMGLVIIAVLLAAGTVGYANAEKDMTKQCLTYHKTLTYEEAVKTCETILNGKKETQ